MTDIKVETLWEIQDVDLFAEGFTTPKGSFVNISKKGSSVTLTLEEAFMILKTARNFAENE